MIARSKIKADQIFSPSSTPDLQIQHHDFHLDCSGNKNDNHLRSYYDIDTTNDYHALERENNSIPNYRHRGKLLIQIPNLCFSFTNDFSLSFCFQPTPTKTKTRYTFTTKTVSTKTLHPTFTITVRTAPAAASASCTRRGGKMV